MAVGQHSLGRALDVGRIGALEDRLELRETDRRAAHGPLLRDVLSLHDLSSREGLEVSTVSQLALVLRCSEFRAGELLGTAVMLTELPGGFEALECGLLGVEQSAVVARQLQPLEDPARLAVWSRLQRQLLADDTSGVQRTPARLRELLSGWVIEADPAAAVERRRAAAKDGDVDYRRRDDGLVDLSAYGVTGPDAHACLSRIRACAAPVGLGDDRPAGKRRLDALVDLILGRNPLPLGADDENPPEDAAEPSRCPTGPTGASCGCRPGSPVPCGAQLTVLVPIGAALGITDELAELVGHGPLEPDLLQELLQAAPSLRAAWVDDAGVPVSVGSRVHRPGRDDPGAVREALLRIAAEPPGPPQPRHPDDHPPPTNPDGLPHLGRTGGSVAGSPPDRTWHSVAGAPPDRTGGVVAGPPPDQMGGTVAGPPQNRGGPLPQPGPPSRGQPRLRTRPHPADTSGPYRVPTRLRRLVTLRSPRCEWPGCGCSAVRCDLDHDVAWPSGATCACQLGPLCRRHHRVKQLAWTKQRTRESGVRWTSPTGRVWLSPQQHPPPAAPVRRPPALTTLDELNELGPAARDAEQWHADPTGAGWDDPDGCELRAADTDSPPEREPELRSRTTTRWSLDLDDPYAWPEAG